MSPLSPQPSARRSPAREEEERQGRSHSGEGAWAHEAALGIAFRPMNPCARIARPDTRCSSPFHVRASTALPLDVDIQEPFQVHLALWSRAHRCRQTDPVRSRGAASSELSPTNGQ